jgi:hypothetical protein
MVYSFMICVGVLGIYFLSDAQKYNLCLNFIVRFGYNVYLGAPKSTFSIH